MAFTAFISTHTNRSVLNLVILTNFKICPWPDHRLVKHEEHFLNFHFLDQSCPYIWIGSPPFWLFLSLSHWGAHSLEIKMHFSYFCLLLCDSSADCEASDFSKRSLKPWILPLLLEWVCVCDTWPEGIIVFPLVKSWKTLWWYISVLNCLICFTSQWKMYSLVVRMSHFGSFRSSGLELVGLRQ